jgi:hypothetical protein
VCRAFASKRKARESVPTDSPKRVSEHSGKPVDSIDGTSIAPIPDHWKPARTIARSMLDRA